jgi:predicted DCC family thiol-disulfide oxidoreductase YuxK
MRRLTVLYDANCGVCRRARSWLEGQAKYVPMEFIAAGSDEARERYPALDHARTLADLTVVGDDRDVYHGANGWLVSLWALRGYREWALRAAASPIGRAAVRGFVDRIARNRYGLSELLGRARREPESCPTP